MRVWRRSIFRGDGLADWLVVTGADWEVQRPASALFIKLIHFGAYMNDSNQLRGKEKRGMGYWKLMD